MKKRSVFIAGGGPSGLAAALLFEQLGWDEIIVAENRASPTDFEKNKSFNYQIDGRGQMLLQRIGVADQLPLCGVANTAFRATVVKPDGIASTISVPIIDPNRPTCYWTTRRNLLSMLANAIEDRGSDKIELLYGHTFEGFSDDPETGRLTANLTGPSGKTRSFIADLVLACDGLASTAREAAQSRPETPAGHFAMTQHPSPSAQMRYKVLNLPPQFTSANGQVAIDDTTMAYIFPSSFSNFTRTGSLFAFPVAGADQPRSLNIIREADHDVWKTEDPEELLAFLEQSYPQLGIRSLVPLQEAEDFVGLRPGKFPEPQYAANLSADLGPDDHRVPIVLIGDAAHAFPPDLGLGVNSALEDLEFLAREIEAKENWQKAVKAHSAKRLPEAKALVRLVQTVFPEQYATRKWPTRRWTALFVVQTILQKVVPFWVDKPAFLLTQLPTLSYTEIELRKLRSERNMRLIGIAALAAIAALILYALL